MERAVGTISVRGPMTSRPVAFLRLLWRVIGMSITRATRLNRRGRSDHTLPHANGRDIGWVPSVWLIRNGVVRTSSRNTLAVTRYVPRFAPLDHTMFTFAQSLVMLRVDDVGEGLSNAAFITEAGRASALQCRLPWVEMRRPSKTVATTWRSALRSTLAALNLAWCWSFERAELKREIEAGRPFWSSMTTRCFLRGCQCMWYRAEPVETGPVRAPKRALAT